MSKLQNLLAMSKRQEKPLDNGASLNGLTNNQPTNHNQESKMQSQTPSTNNDINTKPQEVTDVQLFDDPDIKKEFVILDKTTGKTGVTRRGVSRLTGVSHVAILKQLTSIKGGNKTLPQMLQPFAGQDFEGGNHLPDVLVAALVKYYAYQGKETAQKTDFFLGAVGLRTVIQQSLGWSKIPTYVKPNASEWERRFEAPFYTQLERLTGLKAQGHKRPQLWAKLTKELFYDWLPNGVYEDLKRYQAAGDKNAKLHQYLGEDGVKVFTTHMEVLFTLMHAAQSTEHLIGLLSAHHKRAYQGELKLLEPCKKERAAKWLELVETELLATDDLGLEFVASLAHKIHVARTILR